MAWWNCCMLLYNSSIHATTMCLHHVRTTVLCIFRSAFYRSGQRKIIAHFEEDNCFFSRFVGQHNITHGMCQQDEQENTAKKFKLLILPCPCAHTHQSGKGWSIQDQFQVNKWCLALLGRLKWNKNGRVSSIRLRYVENNTWCATKTTITAAAAAAKNGIVFVLNQNWIPFFFYFTDFLSLLSRVSVSFNCNLCKRACVCKYEWMHDLCVRSVCARIICRRWSCAS